MQPACVSALRGISRRRRMRGARAEVPIADGARYRLFIHPHPIPSLSHASYIRDSVKQPAAQLSAPHHAALNFAKGLRRSRFRGRQRRPSYSAGRPSVAETGECRNPPIAHTRLEDPPTHHRHRPRPRPPPNRPPAHLPPPPTAAAEVFRGAPRLPAITAIRI